ncbi:MAG TPA: hypothetical protein VMA95_06255 [Streptosporangiaceae bacterium]|nr:hypothetical protein [Streptosporangiaceae bacterium]
MNVCAVCGQTRHASANFCTKCGTPFPPAEPAVPAQAAVPPPEAPGAHGAWRPSRPPLNISRSEVKPLIPPDEPAGPGRWRRDTILTVVIAVIIIMAGGGTAAWVLLHRPQHQSAIPVIHATVSSPSSSAPAGQVPSSSPSPGSETPSSQPENPGSSGPAEPVGSLSPTPTPAGTGSAVLVRVGRSAAADPREPEVLAFVKSYFAAINSHSYRQYLSLLSPSLRAMLTKSKFEFDFSSSSDSAATIVRISTTDAGTTAASITFTSHQKPSQSATGTERCTKWVITLYLEDDSGDYLIGQAPFGYEPSDRAC